MIYPIVSDRRCLSLSRLATVEDGGGGDGGELFGGEGGG